MINKNVPCDTDLLLMLSISDDKEINHEQLRNILYDSLKSAASSKNFDFELSTLRLYKRINKKRFLVLHTRVYGGAKDVKNHIDYLIEADNIASECLKNELGKNLIDSKMVIKQYIFFSKDSNEFNRVISMMYPEFKITKVDEDSTLYIGDFIITVTMEDRQIITKAGRMAFDIIEKIVGAPNTNKETISNIIESVINKFKIIETVERAEIKRVHKKYFLIPIAINLVIVFTFASFIYFYFYVFLDDKPHIPHVLF